MGLSLKNFVNININYFKTDKPISSREVVVLLDTNDNIGLQDVVFSSIDDVAFNGVNDEYLADLKAYCKVFFDNNGQKIHYINLGELTGTDAEIAEDLAKEIKELPNEEIVICVLDPSAGAFHTNYTAIINELAKCLVDGITINEEVFKFYGINEKILVRALNKTAPESTDKPEEKYIDCLVYKYGKASIEMSVLAFLSNINVYRGTIEDYTYTKESLPEELEVSIVDDDAIFKALSDFNCNFEIKLPAYGKMNYGGNKLNGKDLVNDFCKIVLSQTLTQRLVGALTQKLRYDESGISVISGIIADELQKYKKFGYLSTDKAWGSTDYYEGQYLIISANTPLLQGYYYTILPFSSLSTDDKKDHKMPNIYIILAESYSVRVINIEGKII